MIRVSVESPTVDGLRSVLKDMLDALTPSEGPIAAPLRDQLRDHVDAAPAPAVEPSADKPARKRTGRPRKSLEETAQTLASKDPFATSTPAVEAEGAAQENEIDDVEVPTGDEDARDEGTAALLDSLTPPAAAPVVTRETLRDTAQQAIERIGGTKFAVELLAKHGAKKFAELPQDKWPEAQRELEKFLKTAKRA